MKHLIKNRLLMKFFRFDRALINQSLFQEYHFFLDYEAKIPIKNISIII